MSQAIIDRCLGYPSFVPTYQINPTNTYYQREDAQTATASNCTWSITAPGKGLLLDPEIFIEFTIKISTTTNDVFQLSDLFMPSSTIIPAPLPNEDQKTDIDQNDRYAPGTGTLRNNMHAMAVRGPVGMAAIFEFILLTLNGQTLSTQPNVYQRHMDRLFMSKEEAEGIATLSSGHFDDGSFTNIQRDLCLTSQLVGAEGITAGTNCIMTLGSTAPILLNNGGVGTRIGETAADVKKRSFMSQHPFHDKNYNNGFTKRVDILRQAARRQCGGELVTNIGILNSNTDKGYADTITIVVYDHCPIGPLYNYGSRDPKSSIGHVSELALSLQIHSNYKALLLQANLPLAWEKLITVDFFTTAPKLLLKWYTPPLSYKIPPEISIPIWKDAVFQKSGITFAATASSSAALLSGVTEQGAYKQTISYNNIRLEQFPDLLLIFISRDPNEILMSHPTDYNAYIERLSISVDGYSGKLLNASGAQLYEMWLKNVNTGGGTKATSDEYKYHIGCAAIRPRDIGLTYGPGLDHPLTIHITCDAVSFNYMPRNGYLTMTGILGGTVGPDTYNSSPGTYKMSVVCMYDRYNLTLNENGGASLSMLKIPIYKSEALQQASTGSFGALKL
jgi:hypothetical protein